MVSHYDAKKPRVPKVKRDLPGVVSSYKCRALPANGILPQNGEMADLVCIACNQVFQARWHKHNNRKYCDPCGNDHKGGWVPVNSEGRR
jgi:PHP family Zn ribbon phosphoesterase